jgi:hypothetical protein
LFSQSETVMNNSFVLVFAVDECKSRCFFLNFVFCFFKWGRDE